MANVEISNSLERNVARRTFPLLTRTRVCRNLFGAVDHEELRCELKRKLQEISEQDQKRWNFNFETNSPLPGEYEWENISEDSLPGFYKETVHKRARVTTGDPSATPDCGFHGLSDMPDQESAAVPRRSSELNQENLSGALNSRPARSPVVRNRRKRVPESPRNGTPQITDFFPKRKRIIESKLDERTSLQASTSSSLEATPRKTIR